MCLAIMSSSSVASTQTATRLLAVEMQGPPLELAAVSNSTPSQAASRQTRSRIEHGVLPIPAVKTWHQSSQGGSE